MATMRDLLSDIDPERISAARSSTRPAARLGPRRQDDLQLVLVHRGSATIAIDDGPPATVRRGRRWRSCCPATARSSRSPPTSRPATRRSRRTSAPPRPLRRAPAGAAAVGARSPTSCAEAVAVTRTPLPTARPLLAALAAAAFWRYAGEAESGPATADDAVDRARRHAHARLADPDLDLRALARAAHVSPPHLVRRFRAELGVTPMAYLWRRRVAHGVDLLTHTGLPVGDIAARAGFKSVYHFSRRVKEETGRAPTVLRRERWRA